MSWDQAKRARDEAGSGKFIRLKDGDRVTGVFRGEPHTFYRAFKDKAEYENWAQGRSFKFRINILLKTAEGWEAKLFEQGSIAFDQLFEAHEKYGFDCVYEIRRKGSGQDDTRYYILF